MITPRILVALTSLALLLAPRPNAAQGSGELPPVVLLHGYRSGPYDWDIAASNLVINYGFLSSKVITPQLYTTSESILQQAGSVNSLLSAYGSTYSNPVLVGHSLGGLVAREVSTQFPAAVLMTIGSPNGGHKALSPQGVSDNLNIMTALSSSRNRVFDYLFQCYVGDFDSHGNYVSGPCYDLSDLIQYVGILVDLFDEIRLRFFYGPAVEDLVPQGPFIVPFNGTTHVNAETSFEKIAVISQLHSFEQNSTLLRSDPWRTFDATGAAAVSSLISASGLAIMFRGFEIADDADEEYPFYEDQVYGGLEQAALGFAIAGFNDTYNNLIGGWPSDGFVPINTQGFPGATEVNVYGPSHLEEPEDGFIIALIRDAGNRHRSP